MDTRVRSMIKTTSRRTFVKAAASGLAASLLEIPSMNASPLNLPIGLQLYTVGQEMDSEPATNKWSSLRSPKRRPRI
jgi:hypothetical protein